MSDHSQWSASQFSRAIACPGQLAIQQLAHEGKIEPVWVERPSSVYAAEGTVAHWLLERELQSGDCAVLVGTEREQDGFSVTIDQGMVDYITDVAERARGIARGGILLSERRVDYSEQLGLPAGEAWGTADIIIVRDSKLIVIDLKYGQGVRVDSEDNPQLLCYGLGALNLVSLTHDIDEVVLCVDQPRLNHWSESTYSIEQLDHWASDTARPTVRSVQTAKSTYRGLGDKEWCDTFLRPSEDACRWCPLAPSCPALAEAVSTATGVTPMRPDEFDDPKPLADGALAEKMAMVPMVEAWASAVAAEAEARLLQGLDVPGYKLVEGRRGNRKWTREEDALRILKATSMRIDEYAPRKVISPAAAEKLHKKGGIGPRHWKQLENTTSRSEGKPTVVKASDPRPGLGLAPVTDDFEAIL